MLFGVAVGAFSVDLKTVIFETPHTVWPGRGVPKVANYGDFFRIASGASPTEVSEALKRFWRSQFGPKLEQKRGSRKWGAPGKLGGAVEVP